MTPIKELKIIGISVRTTNKDNQASKDLGKLWEQFYADNVIGKVLNKINENFYSVYTDYESNYTGAYTTIIGVAVENLDQIPDGLIGRTFPAENFRTFTEKREMPNAVVNTWLDIWNIDQELNRKYTYDLEVYSEKSQNGKDSKVEIFISVK